MDRFNRSYTNLKKLIIYNSELNIYNEKRILLLLGKCQINNNNIFSVINQNKFQKLFDDQNVRTKPHQLQIILKDFIENNLKVKPELVNNYYDKFLIHFSDKILPILKSDFMLQEDNINYNYGNENYTKKTLNISFTPTIMKKYLFEKGINRLHTFNYLINSSLFSDPKNYFESNIDLKDIYLAILLVVIQVFSDGNHRSAKYYLQSQNIKINDKLFYNLVDDFRNYSNLDGGEISQTFNINKTNNFAKKFMSSLTSFIKKEYPITKKGHNIVYNYKA